MGNHVHTLLPPSANVQLESWSSRKKVVLRSGETISTAKSGVLGVRWCGVEKPSPSYPLARGGRSIAAQLNSELARLAENSFSSHARQLPPAADMHPVVAWAALGQQETFRKGLVGPSCGYAPPIEYVILHPRTRSERSSRYCL